MKVKQLGQSDLMISRLGLGSWAIGGNIGEWGWGEQPEKQSISTIHAALDSGINWIDTAPAYGLGNAEVVIKKALQQTANKPYVFSKCGLCWKPGSSELFNQLTAQSITQEVEQSLQRLGLDCIDLYQIHWPLPASDIEQAWSTLIDLQKQGKIRHFGVSNFSATQLTTLHTIAPITSNQPSYSLLNREVENEVLPWCEKNSVGSINHSTMANGLLTGAMNKSRFASLDLHDWRHKNHLYKEPVFSKNLMLVAFLRQLAAQKGCSVAQLSIAWTLAHPATTGSIIGARTPEQLSELCGASEVILTSDELQSIATQCLQLGI